MKLLLVYAFNFASASNTLDKRRELYEQMRAILLHILPKALWKRELDIHLEQEEEIVLMELVPGITLHESWRSIVDIVTRDIVSLLDGCCRECGKRNAQIVCGQCGVGRFCNKACQVYAMQDAVFGHYKIECKYVSVKKQIKK
jgi:hypothetical protein